MLHWITLGCTTFLPKEGLMIHVYTCCRLEMANQRSGWAICFPTFSQLVSLKQAENAVTLLGNLQIPIYMYIPALCWWSSVNLHIARWLWYSCFEGVGANMMPSKADLKRSPESLSKDSPIQMFSHIYPLRYHPELLVNKTHQDLRCFNHSYPNKISVNINRSHQTKTTNSIQSPTVEQDLLQLCMSPPELPDAPGFSLFSEHLWVVDSLRLRDGPGLRMIPWWFRGWCKWHWI